MSHDEYDPEFWNVDPDDDPLSKLSESRFQDLCYELRYWVAQGNPGEVAKTAFELFRGGADREMLYTLGAEPEGLSASKWNDLLDRGKKIELAAIRERKEKLRRGDFSDLEVQDCGPEYARELLACRKEHDPGFSF